MYKIATTIATLAILASCSSTQPIDYVDTFIGTGYHGHTYPGATTPFGAVQLSPDTRHGDWDACAGYHYSDSTIDGFSHTHLSGTGCADLADVMFYPSTEVIEVTDNVAQLPAHNFSHDNEMSTPGYYSVDLHDAGVKVELTATPHCGVHRYNFYKGQTRAIVIDMTHTVTDEIMEACEIKVLNKNEIEGMRITTGWVPNQHIYFNAQFSQPIIESKVIDNKQLILYFDKNTTSLEANVALSIVGYKGAKTNLESELSGFDFDKVKAQAQSVWSDSLSTITVEGGSEEEMTNFYTALYHTMLTPNVISDTDGKYRRNSNQISSSDNNKYSTLSLWDTFRAWNPLQTLTNSELVDDMVDSMLDIYDATGELPMWPLSSGETGTMIGYHAVSVIADAYLRGVGDFDAEKALDAMVRSSNINKKGSDYYTTLGYIPANIKKESVSCLLEFTYDDWCIATMAQKMGKEQIAKEYFARANNYINVFDGSKGFFRGKNADGSFSSQFNEFVSGRDYTEATPWQYRFFVPHDVNGMIQLFGGVDKFSEELDRLFTLESDNAEVGMVDITGIIGQYAHGNEPSHHMAYLYNYIGQPWKTQERTRMILDEMYAPTPEGIIGNEDCGQMSAWYILSSLGIYAVCPGSGEYALTTPLFPKATMKLANGRSITITANSPKENIYIDKVELNGKVIENNYITYDEIMQGGELKFTLSSKPNLERGVAPSTFPHSMSSQRVASIPYTTSQVALFEDSIEMDLGSTTAGAEIRYTLTGEEPTQESTLYTKPFRLTKSTTVQAKAFCEGMQSSATFKIEAQKAIFLRPTNLGANASQGVNYKCYLGKFSDIEQISSGEYHNQGSMAEPSLEQAPREDHYGYIFKGYIKVEKAGIWQFMTKSDDGSLLKIGDKVVVDNNGSHAAIEATGEIALNEGFYPYTLYYFEDYEGQELKWGWKAPGESSFSQIPTSALFR